MAAFRSSAALLLVTGLLVTGLLAAACSGKDPYNPGTPLGTFHVEAALASSTCGPVPDPWEFDVRISHEGSTLYWVQGGAPISGIVDVNAKVVLKATEQRDLRPADPRTRTAACSIVREDRLEVALAGPTEERLLDVADTTRLAGKLLYRFTPTSGSDCTDQTTDLGGDFAALPCEIIYDVTANVTDAPEKRR